MRFLTNQFTWLCQIPNIKKNWTVTHKNVYLVWFHALTPLAQLFCRLNCDKFLSWLSGRSFYGSFLHYLTKITCVIHQVRLVPPLLFLLSKSTFFEIQRGNEGRPKIFVCFDPPRLSTVLSFFIARFFWFWFLFLRRTSLSICSYAMEFGSTFVPQLNWMFYNICPISFSKSASYLRAYKCRKHFINLSGKSHRDCLCP